MVIVLMFAGAGEMVRRNSGSYWLLFAPSLITAFVVGSSIDKYRRFPDGVLHFQIDSTHVSFDGLAFRPVISVPYPALKRVLVGDRYLSLASPVLFEFQASATTAHGLSPFQNLHPCFPVVLCSYRGVTREAFQVALHQFLPAQIPVVLFDVIDKPDQLHFQTNNT